MSDDIHPLDQLNQRLRTARDWLHRTVSVVRADLRPVRETVHASAARESDTVVVSTTIVAFGILVRILGRYVPEYLRVLGAGPVLIGLLGSLGILLGIAYPYLDSIPNLGSDGRTNRDFELPERLNLHRWPSLLIALAALGLLLWLLTPRLGAASHAGGWVGLFFGLCLLAAWKPLGFEVAFPSTDRIADLGPEWPLDGDDSGGTHRWDLLVGFVLVALFLTVFSTFLAGFRVVMAIAVAVGLCAMVFQYLSEKTATETRTFGTEFRDVSAVLSELRSLPADGRRLLIGDTLVQFATGMVSVFVVIVVTEVVGVDAVFLGQQFQPSAFFGVLVAIELGVGLVGLRLMRGLQDSEPEWLLGVSFLVTALFPLLLVSAPADPLVVGVLFAVFGIRVVGFPARRVLVDQHTAPSVCETVEQSQRHDRDESKKDEADSRGTTDSYRLARNAATVPSALVGGVLYAANPQLAFGIATAIGLLGLREFFAIVRPLSQE